MDKKKLRLPLVGLVFLILFLNGAALKLHWYSAISWFDMPMHFLGGFWVALFFIFLLSKEDFSWKFTFKVLGGVFLIGALWEIFEVSVNLITVRENFDLPDTFSDLFFDLLGGGGALFMLKKCFWYNK